MTSDTSSAILTPHCHSVTNSTTPHCHKTVNASVFADATDCNQDDDNHDYEVIDWDPEISNHEEFFTQDTNYGSENSFDIMNNQPSRPQRDLLNTVKNYETPDPGRIRVMQNAESDIKIDYLTDPNAATSSLSSGDE